MNIGLFFGSFNPIHVGHLIIANVMVESADLDEVWFIVSPLNPFKKSSRSLIHEFDRIDMVELAVEDNPAFKASDIEFHLPKPSYTIDTIREFQQSLGPDTNLFWLIGSDMLADLPTWHGVSQLLDMVNIIVVSRAGSLQPNFPSLRPTLTVEQINKIRAHALEVPLIDISSTMLRQRIAQDQSVRYFLPEPVLEFIYERKLYCGG